MNGDDGVKKRAEVILRVRSGQMNATQAAKELGVSRKTYYKWEKRALQGMVEELSERSSGRPGSEADEEKEAMRKRIRELESELEKTKQSLAIRKLLNDSTDAEKKG